MSCTVLLCSEEERASISTAAGTREATLLSTVARGRYIGTGKRSRRRRDGVTQDSAYCLPKSAKLGVPRFTVCLV